ncbi:transcriptional regulator [Pseudomonas sp. FSL R10-1350]|uniref:Rha family transcriptional regulator n=1 Tax=Pseudomonas sp. FSL R10-1350 TaxID=2662197 RepID=UPI0012966033|nr:Rha family transcriptional regulator [Pseudomonas sp. FSL R10-1350]MQU62984.1 transcriptional regulator [Pseudomonas sp. FSL R10-1350]
MKAIAPVTTPVLVELVDGQPTTTSLDVAAHFGKRHDTVLRAVRTLDSSPEFNARNFAEVEYQDAKGERRPQFRMTRDGFTFLCMGFTGKEAAKWKEAYISAFNQMETVLKEGVPAKQKHQTKLLTDGLSSEQQEAIKALVKARVDELPEAQRAKAAITCWSSLKSKFGCTYKEIAPERFTEAVSLVARVVLEGELLEPEEPKVVGRLAIDFTVARWIAENPYGFQNVPLEPADRLRVPIRALYGMDCKSPTLALLNILERSGYEVEACKLEVLALKEHIDVLDGVMGNIQVSIENTRSRAFPFACKTKKADRT